MSQYVYEYGRYLFSSQSRFVLNVFKYVGIVM